MNDKVPPRKARQGREGLPVLVVLLAALALAAVVWVLVEIYGIFIDERQPVETQPSSDIPVEQGGAPRTLQDDAVEN